MTQTTDVIRKFLDDVDSGGKEITNMVWEKVQKPSEPVNGWVTTVPTDMNRIIITYEVKDE